MFECLILHLCTLPCNCIVLYFSGCFLFSVYILVLRYIRFCIVDGHLQRLLILIVFVLGSLVCLSFFEDARD